MSKKLFASLFLFSSFAASEIALAGSCGQHRLIDATVCTDTGAKGDLSKAKFAILMSPLVKRIEDKPKDIGSLFRSVHPLIAYSGPSDKDGLFPLSSIMIKGECTGALATASSLLGPAKCKTDLFELEIKVGTKANANGEVKSTIQFSNEPSPSEIHCSNQCVDPKNF